MNIREALLAEHSKGQTIAIVDYVDADGQRFSELMSVFFEGDHRLTQRAAWPMNFCAERHPGLIRPFLPKLIQQLPRQDVHNAVKRNVLRLLQFVELPKRLHGKVYSHCVDLMDDANESIAVRAFALTVAIKIANGEVDLLNELRLIVKKHLPHSSPGFKVRARELF